MSLILLVLFVLFIVAALPNRGFHNFGFSPLGIAGVALVFSGLSADDGSALKIRNMLSRSKQLRYRVSL